MSALTQERLKQLLIYNPETGEFRNRIMRAPNAARDSVAGGIRIGGYERISIWGRRYYSHRLAWLYVYGQWPVGEIDHINGIRNDNRICNLRVASRAQNLQNQKIRDVNKSGYKGVSWSKARKRWVAAIQVNRRKITLGRFRCIEEARLAYEAAAREHFGEFALIQGRPERWKQ